jgi:DNA-binding transcriptional LysR family regulator
MNDRLQELVVFVRAAESGSFSRAARELGLTQPSVSRIVSELEARLGVKLLLRTTRQVTLTDAGSAFLDRARQILADLDEAEHAARGVDSLQGLVRLAAPVLYGTLRIIPHLPLLMDQHPGLRVNLTIADHYQDLIADGADVAIRMGKLADSSMGARKLDELQRYVVAAPAYLAKRGVPHTPAELAEHDCIFGPGGFGAHAWEFTRRATVTSVNVHGRVQTHSGPGVIASAIAGLGVALSTDLAAAEAMRNGTLVRLLEDYEMPPVEVHAVLPQGPRPSPKVRGVVEFLAARIGANI